MVAEQSNFIDDDGLSNWKITHVTPAPPGYVGRFDRGTALAGSVHRVVMFGTAVPCVLDEDGVIVGETTVTCVTFAVYMDDIHLVAWMQNGNIHYEPETYGELLEAEGSVGEVRPLRRK
jgi:hypothetical protein